MADEPTEPDAEATDDDTQVDVADGAGATDDSTEPAEAEGGRAETSAKAKTAEKAGKADKATGPTVKRKVVSKRVTPKGGGPVQATGRSGKVQKGSTAAHAHAADGDDADYSSRYTPPTAKYAPGPSPWWVPALMFGLLILGALIIMLNYMGVFGDADNVRLIVGLAFILGGIITATQLR